MSILQSKNHCLKSQRFTQNRKAERDLRAVSNIKLSQYRKNDERVNDNAFNIKFLRNYNDFLNWKEKYRIIRKY